MIAKFTMKRAIVFLAAIGLVLFLANFLLFSRQPSLAEKTSREELRRKIDLLIAKSKAQEQRGKVLEQQLNELKQSIVPVAEQKQGADNPVLPKTDGLVLPVIVFACNRPTVTVALDDLIKYRPSKEKFPIIVSQDCGHEETSNAIQRYKDEIHAHIKQPDLGPIPGLTAKERKLEGYFKIARHYKWALGQIFDVMKYKAVIIMEDDLNIAPDFFSYFESLYALLRSDKSLYCISAWNDNGKTGLIEDDSELLHRSDFFPGLGWMMLDSLWDELRDKWPKGFWDDWLREEGQRQGRACIRPEISRTHTFGEKGVSLGLFYKQHLKFIVLNQKDIDWSTRDLSYLHQETYDEAFTQEVYNTPLINLSQLESASKGSEYASVRLLYSTKENFKLIAKTLKIMTDFKEGVPRTAYKGVVQVVYNGMLVYIAPPPDWKGYDKTWV